MAPSFHMIDMTAKEGQENKTLFLSIRSRVALHHWNWQLQFIFQLLSGHKGRNFRNRRTCTPSTFCEAIVHLRYFCSIKSRSPKMEAWFQQTWHIFKCDSFLPDLRCNILSKIVQSLLHPFRSDWDLTTLNISEQRDFIFFTFRQCAASIYRNVR